MAINAGKIKKKTDGWKMALSGTREGFSILIVIIDTYNNDDGRCCLDYLRGSAYGFLRSEQGPSQSCSRVQCYAHFHSDKTGICCIHKHHSCVQDCVPLRHRIPHAFTMGAANVLYYAIHWGEMRSIVQWYMAS